MFTLENISPNFVGLGCKPTSYLVFQFQTRLKMTGNHAIGTVLKIGSKQWKNKLGFFLRISNAKLSSLTFTTFVANQSSSSKLLKTLD